MTDQSIIRKIRALRARAADAASTEAEAAMAAAKAAELLAKHNLTIDEADARAEGVGAARWRTDQKRMPAAMFAFHGIEKLCNVEMLHFEGYIEVIGARADVEVALYFLDIVRNACASCWARYQRSGRQAFLSRSIRSAGMAYRKGVATRLGDQMVQMARQAAASGDTSATAGNALVPVKNAMIQTWIKTQGYKIKSRAPTIGDISAFAAGARDAEGVAIQRGVGSAAAERRLIA